MGQKRAGAQEKKGRVARGPRLTLDTIVGTRQTVARLVRAYLTDRLTEPKYRGAIYGLRSLRGLLRDEKSEELLQRLGEVEKRLGLQRPDGTVIRFKGEAG